MFESHPYWQRIIRCGLLGYDRGTGGKHTSSSGVDYQPPLHDDTSACDSSCSPSEKDTERKARLLQEAKKNKEKAEKKQLKKQNRKERKEMEKKKQNPETNNEEKDDVPPAKTEEPVSYERKDGIGSREKGLAAKGPASNVSDTESTDKDEGSSDSEELDMTSTFVSKAALIARRQLEHKTRAERKEKKVPNKEEHRSVPNKKNEGREPQKKDSMAPSFEDNIKISTELANIGNNFASGGDYFMAVKYFTDAIKYNPKEFKLFGNRSFCFEKLQEYDKALTDAELSLGIRPGWVKGLFRKGRALAGLKMYEEAAQAFREVLKLESSYAEAAQELMRVQILELMEYGFTREQSSNALIIHGTVTKALEVLTNLQQPGALSNGMLPPAIVANTTGISPILSASINPAQSIETPPIKPLGSVQNIANGQSHPKPFDIQHVKMNGSDNQPSLVFPLNRELFPVWVGNLNYPVTEATIFNLFNRVGPVHSVKLLQSRRCAFVNFTIKHNCDKAIRRFHGCDLNGNNIAVRYPDRIPPGIGISRSALRAEDLQDENLRHHVDGRTADGSQRPFRPYKPVPAHRGNH
ncbi:uncharacterized protein ACNS7B_021644 isoform 1-T1 [Menidia menidia]